MKPVLSLFILTAANIFLVYSLENVAVVEHSPKMSDDPMNTIKENINEYRKYLEKIKDQNVDVIVFPEYGLTGYVEDVENYAINLKSSQISKELSDMALEYQMNMVVNLLEKYDNDIYCNTNLVFNKSGAIIAKYRKININPVTETKLTAGIEVVEFMLEDKLFSTITNDDILFDYPTKNFSKNVTHVAIPMNWKNLRPFNTATSIQAAYAIKNNKMVLAANLNDVDNNKTGSGIHSPHASESFITGKKTSDVITNHKLNRKTRNDDYLDTDDKTLDKLPLDTMEFISGKHFEKFYDTTWKADMNYEDQNCFIYFPNDDNGMEPLLPWGVLSTYKAVYINERPFKVRMCAYLPCDTQFEAKFQLKNCGRRYINTNVTFDKVEMKTNLDFDKSMPITLDYNLRPIDGVIWKEQDGNIEMNVLHIKQRVNLVAIVEYTPIEVNTTIAVNEAHNLQFKNYFLLILILIFVFIQ